MANRKTLNRKLLYHLLPVAFWLLAIGGSLFFYRTWPGYVTALMAWLCMVIINSIQRHSSSVEECFWVALLLGVASYWLPTILFLIIPVWVFLIYRNLFSGRSLMASIIGFAVVAVWASVAVSLEWIANPWTSFFAKENAWGWIPTGAVVLAWSASTIARQNLRER